MMKICICTFLILITLSSTCCRNVIRTVPAVKPGIISLKNVTLSLESTICMEIMIKQFYQATSARDQKGQAHPRQIIFASEGYGNVYTVPAYDCTDFHPGCEAESKLMIGEQWEYGKVFLIFEGMTSNTLVIPAWKPGTMTKLCFTRNESIFEVYYDGDKVSQTTDVKIMEGLNSTNINIMNYYLLYMPLNGDLYSFDIWDRILQPKEIRDWSGCKSSSQGNIMKWNTVINTVEQNRNYFKSLLFFTLTFLVDGFKIMEAEKSCADSNEDKTGSININ